MDRDGGPAQDMSLRAYVAIEAMKKLMDQEDTTDGEIATPRTIAKGAVVHADALLAELEREEKGS